MSKGFDSSIYWLLLGVDDLASEAALAQTRATPDNANSWLKHGLVELRRGERSAARASLARAVRLDKSLMEGWALLAALWAEAGKPLVALITAQRVLTMRPDLAPLVALTAFALAEHDAPLEALDALEAVTSTGYVTPQLVRLHSRLLGQCGFPEQANRALRALWVTSDTLER